MQHYNRSGVKCGIMSCDILVHDVEKTSVTTLWK